MNFYDMAYGIGAGVSSPYWLLAPRARRKVLGALRNRRAGGLLNTMLPGRAVVLIHAVSLGEMNATRSLVQMLRELRPDVQFVITSTTETGFARGRELYSGSMDVLVVRFPLDFSGPVRRLLDAIKPQVVVLMELEIWPNFLLHCCDRDIPVVVANARLTETSFRNYKRAGMFLRRTFQRITLVCAQDQTYAQRFARLGVPSHHIVVTGTMKFDNANLGPPSPGAGPRAAVLSLRPGVEPIWVCGSTGPGEEEICLRIYRRLLMRFPRLRLVLVPRHPERFDEVDQLIMDSKFHSVRLGFVQSDPPPRDPAIPPVILVDAMGVLRDFYAVSDIVFVGRTLVDLGVRQHGSDMIEPAALRKPVIVGPYTGNFTEAMNAFRASEAIIEVRDEQGLEQSIAVLLSSPDQAREMGKRAGTIVSAEQGATLRHARLITQIMSARRENVPIDSERNDDGSASRETAPTRSPMSGVFITKRAGE
jgi:3-deoxy-D-manno-octulosonic-acid transferase